MIDVDVQFERDGFVLAAAFQTDAPILGVFGRSGAGKSTLLHLMAGLETPEAGFIRVAGRTLFDSTARVDCPAHRRRIGFVFQDGRLFPHLSVASNLRYGRGRRSDKRRRLDYDAVVELLALRRLLERRVHQLSGGERQRVALGRALLSGPDVLLLDEPLASLDRARKRSILPFLRRAEDASGIPMLYVSHDLTEILQLTDRLVVLEAGALVGHGSVAELSRYAGSWETMHDLGLRNVILARVRDHDREAGLTRLRLRGDGARPTTLSAPLNAHPRETDLHVAIAPADIALALHEITDTSIQNQLPGEVKRITSHADRAVAEIDIGETLLVEVSHRTVKTMRLEPGRRVVCLIKSNAIEPLA